MRTTFLTLGLALLLGLAVAVGGAAGSRHAIPHPVAAPASPITQFHGTVTSRNQTGRWFDVRVTTTSKVVRFHTASSTRWMSCSWSDIERGHLVAVGAHRTSGQWLAVTIRALHHPEIEH